VPALIDTLLSTPDNVEVVRDQIAAILKVEIAHQGELGLDPAPRVFLERSNPWGALLEDPADESPIVNVWFDTETFDGLASNVTARQKADATFNVDVYCFGTSSEDGAGHAPGDEVAALACLATLRLVRQILMSEHYTYLGLPRGLVWKRWPQTIGLFRPQTDDKSLTNIIAGRLALVVSFNEDAPRVDGPALETIALEVKRAGTGELYLAAEYNHASP
jgi:hypothetical protein